MNTDDLIKDLASNLKPVKKQSSPNVFAIKYLMILLLIIVVGILSLQFRSDLSSEIKSINFVLDICLNIFVLLSGIFLTGWFSTVGRNYNPRYKVIMLGLFAAILGFNAYRLSLTTFYFKSYVINAIDTTCFAIVMAFSFLSTVIMIIAVSKRIVLNPGLVGAIIGFLSFSVGSFVIGMHCPITLDEHVTISHTLLPMISGTIAGYLSGKVFLKI